MRAMDEHEVVVYGVWHNDSTAGVEAFCSSCDQRIGYWGDGCSLDKLTQAVAGHRA
jgi:hypothetical protein